MTPTELPQVLNDAFALQTPPDACPYLARETAQLDVRFLDQIGALEYEDLLGRGWRRQGASFFRPVCATCRKCVSLRVVADRFEPTKSQRRTLRRNSDVRVEIEAPVVTRRHVELFEGYHQDMNRRRGWPYLPLDREGYRELFLSGRFDFAREFQYYRQDSLIGVGLVDVTAQASSSVYFFHDPAWRPLAPGVFSLLTELNYAKQLGLAYHFLGYWIADCPSMAYKSKFGPHETLRFLDNGSTSGWSEADDPPPLTRM